MSTSGLEREIKLRFDDPAAARTAILGIGATQARGRRLQQDRLLDTPDGMLRGRRCVLRIRTEEGRSLLTYKGPVQPSPMKLREERETAVADGETLLHVFEQLGFAVWFRYEKYREEFGSSDAVIALDETPIGTYVEIEGSERAITAIAAALGRSPADYILDSYWALHARHCAARGVGKRDMVFDR